LRIHHIYGVCSSLACPVLHRIALAVVSKWRQVASAPALVRTWGQYNASLLRGPEEFLVLDA
jgi:hypothetical protein